MSCPVCKKPADPKYRPFCSRRCADIDLGRWLTGSYVIPGPDGEAEDLPDDDTPRPLGPGPDSSDF